MKHAWLIALLMVLVSGCTQSQPLTQPVTVQVHADERWQSTGYRLEAEHAVRIQYLSGTLQDAETTLTDATGSGYICGAADCCEPMPYEPRSALIARIGPFGDPYFVGNDTEIYAPVAGDLYLRINDCDEGLYDNTGVLDIEISPAD